MKTSNNVSKKRIEYNTYIYTVAVMSMLARLLFIYSGLINTWFPSFILLGMNLLFLFLLAYKIIFLQTYNKKNLFVIGVFLVILAISYSYTKYETLIYTAAAMIAMQNVDLKKVLSYTYKFRAVFIGIHTIAYAIVYKVNPSMIDFDYRFGDTTSRPRHNFLLGHANIVAMLISWTVLEYMYVNYEKLNKKKIFVLWLVNFIYYQFTNSNSSMIVVTVVSILIILSKENKKVIDKIISGMSKYFFAFCSVVFPMLCVVYTSLSGPLLEAWNNLSYFFSGRLLYGACAYNISGISWIGKRITYINQKTYWHGNWFDGMVFDNTYILFFVSYGYIALLFLALLFIKSDKCTSKEDKIMLIVCAVYTMMENYVLNSIFCFAIVILGKVYFSKINGGKNESAKG